MNFTYFNFEYAFIVTGKFCYFLCIANFRVCYRPSLLSRLDFILFLTRVEIEQYNYTRLAST